MLIFKKLQSAIKATKKNLVLYSSSSDLGELEKEKLALLMSIVDYINTYEWLQRDSIKERVKAFLKSKYDYNKVAEEFGITKNSLQVSITYASKVLENKIGSNTIDLILKGELETAKLQLNLGLDVFNGLSLVIGDIADKLPQAANNTSIGLCDCTKELEFLSAYTYIKALSSLEGLDKAKLSFIRYVLESNDEKYSNERNLLIKYLNGVVGGIGELKELLKSLNVFY